MIVPVLRQPKRSHVAKSLAGKPSTESHLKCHGRTSLLGNTRAIVQHPEPSLISSTAAPDPFCDTEFASSGVACSFRSSISPACSFRLKDRVLFQIHIIATRSCHMQQVQTSQPVVTWTVMKAIFTGTIRSVAANVAFSASDNNNLPLLWALRIRFSAARYSFLSRSSWPTLPVM